MQKAKHFSLRVSLIFLCLFNFLLENQKSKILSIHVDRRSSLHTSTIQQFPNNYFHYIIYICAWLFCYCLSLTKPVFSPSLIQQSTSSMWTCNSSSLRKFVNSYYTSILFYVLSIKLFRSHSFLYFFFVTNSFLYFYCSFYLSSPLTCSHAIFSSGNSRLYFLIMYPIL